ncbi:MAG: radical SAM protein [Elusimicrobiales bacterium]
MEGVYKKIWRQRTKSNKINKLFVYVTSSCNLRCSYCFYSSYKKKKSISFEAFKRAFKKFLDISENPEVIFIGGEPLIEKEKVVKMMRYAVKSARISIFTNATLIDRTVADFIKQNNINLIVSIDGDLKTNDRNRRFIGFKSSVYKRVLSVLEKYNLKDYTSVNMVITPKTINSLSNNIKHLYEIGFKSIGISFDYSSNWCQKSILILKKELKKVFIDYLKMIKEHNAYRFANMYEVFYKIKNKKIPPCSNLILFPDGNFYLCDKIISMNENERNLFKIKKNIIREREIFFDFMNKNEISSSQGFCQIGIYLYLKYIKKLNDDIVKLRLLEKSKLQSEIEEILTNYFTKLLKFKYFTELHRV